MKILERLLAQEMLHVTLYTLYNLKYSVPYVHTAVYSTNLISILHIMLLNVRLRVNFNCYREIFFKSHFYIIYCKIRIISFEGNENIVYNEE